MNFSCGRHRAAELAGALLVSTSLLLAGCAGEEAATFRPIEPSFEVNKPRAPIGSPIEVTYRFEVGPDSEPIPKDYKVFVHFVDAQHDELLFTDDHEPPRPTSEWKPGETIEYTRTVFIPLYPYLGTATVEMGLYDPDTGERLALAGQEDGRLAYVVGELTLLDQKENIFLVYKEGWHELESSPENPNLEWQWTKKEAVCSFRNPKVDALLYIEADTNVEALGGSQTVTLYAGETEIGRFVIDGRDVVLHKIPVPASALGEEDWVDLRIVSEKTFVPAELGLGADDRELGLRVYHLYIDPRPGT